jgi:hypothetical protein
MSEYWVEDELFGDSNAEFRTGNGSGGVQGPVLEGDSDDHNENFKASGVATGQSRKQYLNPTSTSNPQRPRTLAAKWDDGTLVVMMRPNVGDSGWGPLIAYEGVTRVMWNSFRSAVSKGAWIKVHLDDAGIGWSMASSDSDPFWFTVAPFVKPPSIEDSFYSGVQANQKPTSGARRKAQQAVRDRRSVTQALGYKRRLT